MSFICFNLSIYCNLMSTSFSIYQLMFNCSIHFFLHPFQFPFKSCSLHFNVFPTSYFNLSSIHFEHIQVVLGSIASHVHFQISISFHLVTMFTSLLIRFYLLFTLFLSSCDSCVIVSFSKRWVAPWGVASHFLRMGLRTFSKSQKIGN